jgi:hypothetical protein
LILFVPTPTWALQGRTQSFLMRRFPRLAMAFAGALNGFFQHWHLYDHRVWADILESNRWSVEQIHGLGGARSEFLFRAFLPTGFLAFLAKRLTGHYPNVLLRHAPAWLVRPIVGLLQSALEKPLVPATDRAAYEYLLVARARPGAERP